MIILGAGKANTIGQYHMDMALVKKMINTPIFVRASKRQGWAYYVSTARKITTSACRAVISRRRMPRRINVLPLS